MSALHLLAPAKINVYLRIVGRRADGYHLLDSLMVPISLYDEISLEVEPSTVSGPEIVVTCDDPTIPSDETNLAYRAAALVCRDRGLHARVIVHLHKRIPAGAGLGGGSSDAAAILRGLNTLLHLGLSLERLSQLGVRLGADVPFFLVGGPARIAGIGDIVTSVPPLAPRWIVLVVPPFGVSTPWAYRRFDELPPTASPSGPPWKPVPGQWPPRQYLVNDLEPAVCATHPQIAALQEALIHLGAEGARMSGSGSSVFGLFPEPAAAMQAATALQGHGRIFVSEPVAAFTQLA